MGDGDDEIWDEEGVELSVLLVDLGQGTRFGKVSVQNCLSFVYVLSQSSHVIYAILRYPFWVRMVIVVAFDQLATFFPARFSHVLLQFDRVSSTSS